MCQVLLYLKKQRKSHISYKKRITTNTVWVKSLYNTDDHSKEAFNDSVHWNPLYLSNP